MYARFFKAIVFLLSLLTEGNSILNGRDTTIENHPYHVNLYFNAEGGENNTWPICGGTIFNETHIITAAHCFKHLKCIGKYTIVAGKTSCYQDNDAAVGLVEIHLHKEFVDDGTYKNDIALVRLNTTLEFSDAIQPMSIYNGILPVNVSVVIPGCGLLKNGNFPETLQVVDLVISDKQECIDKYKNNGNNSKEIVDDMICTTNLAKEEKDTAKGDSGSALIYENQIVCVNSFGSKNYGQLPSVCTSLYTMDFNGFCI